MKREIIIRTSGGRVLTSNGLLPVAGNTGFRPGEAVFLFDGAVLGQQRQQGRPLPYATNIPAAAVPVASSGYHFASSSSLEMYYTDENFVITKTKTISAPVEGASLLIHCYNTTTEYLVWLIGARCIIVRNGTTAHDFTSLIPDTASEKYLDAYIDENNDLVWVFFSDTSLENSPQGKFGKYKNSTCLGSRIVTTPTTTMVSDISQALSNLSVTAVQISQQDTHYRAEEYQGQYAVKDPIPVVITQSAVVVEPVFMYISDVFLWDMTCIIDIRCLGRRSTYVNGQQQPASRLDLVQGVDVASGNTIYSENSFSLMGSLVPYAYRTYTVYSTYEIKEDDTWWIRAVQTTYELRGSVVAGKSHTCTSVAHSTNLGGSFSLVRQTQTSEDYGTDAGVTRDLLVYGSQVIYDYETTFQGGAWKQKGSTLLELNYPNSLYTDGSSPTVIEVPESRLRNTVTTRFV